jgi:hypothetical protein
MTTLVHSGTGRRRVTAMRAAYAVFVVAIILVMIFPLYGLGNSIEPRVLGLPFSMVWVIFWILVEMAGLIAFYLLDERLKAGGEI